jgi:signal transduction histidine kinase
MEFLCYLLGILGLAIRWKGFRYVKIQFQSIQKLSLILSTIVIVTAVNCAFNVYTTNRQITEMFNAKGDVLADFNQNAGVYDLANYDFLRLEKLVQISQKDPDVGFAAFYSDSGKLLTKNSNPVSETTDYLLFERVITGKEGKTLGTFKAGYKKEIIVQAIQRGLLSTVLMVLISMLFVTLATYLSFMKREALIDEQRLQLANSSKFKSLGEMAGGIAHEINNPLATIQTLSEQLSEGYADQSIDEEEAADIAKKISKTTLRISKIIAGLKSFSREGGRDPMEKVELKPVLENAAIFCKERFKHGSVDLTIEDIPEALTFYGRETQISQVILNLLNNAFDAIAKDQERWVRISARDKGPMVEIRITDSGKGISESVRAKLFNPFFTTKEIGKGTGLGLSISLGIVKEHGGELTIDVACPNTCFQVTLPKAKVGVVPVEARNNEVA